MFEQMLKEMLIKMIKEDINVRSTLIDIVNATYQEDIIYTIKDLIKTDESVQDVIRKQATMDIWEDIRQDVDAAIENAIDNLTFDVNVSR